jgi:ERF superfamily protein
MATKNSNAATLPMDEVSGTKEVTLQPARLDVSAVTMFERLATNPDVDVEKLQKLIEMQERILDRNAKADFDADFSQMQPEIPEIDEKGAIRDRAGNVQSTYARNEDIQQVLRPILKKFGFSLSFETHWPDGGKRILVIGILSHRGGHSRRSEFLSDPDTSGNKNTIQSLGSATSYGRRYTTMDLLNITSRYKTDRDDDGQTTKTDKPPSPPGFDVWVDDLVVAAEEGFEKFKEAWNPQAVEAFRLHLAKTQPGRSEVLKARAMTVSRNKKAAQP